MLADTLSLLTDVATKVAATFAHNWPYLLAGSLGAAAVQVYVGTDKVAGWLRRRRGAAVAGSVGAAVATPLCSCGTTAWSCRCWPAPCHGRRWWPSWSPRP